MKATGGKTADKTAFVKAMRAAHLTDTPRGPVRFDDKGNVIGNIFIRKIVKENGKLWQKTLKTYANIGQFWPFDEKKFLAQPVYSRDFPPLKS